MLKKIRSSLQTIAVCSILLVVFLYYKVDLDILFIGILILYFIKNVRYNKEQFKNE